VLKFTVQCWRLIVAVKLSSVSSRKHAFMGE
jgi:hypothetical protein